MNANTTGYSEVEITEGEERLIREKSAETAQNMWEDASRRGERPVTKTAEGLFVEVRVHLLKFDKRMDRMENEMTGVKNEMTDIRADIAKLSADIANLTEIVKSQRS